MKTLFTTLIFAVLSLNIASSQTLHHNSRLSLTSDIGFVNSDILHNPVRIVSCFECFGALEEVIPKPSVRWSMGMEVRLGKSHYIGAAYMVNRIKYDERYVYFFGFESSAFEEVNIKYQGAQLLYMLALVQNDAVQFSLAAGAQYDNFKLPNKHYWLDSMREDNFSGLLKIEFAFSAGGWNQFTLSPLFKMAIKSYNDTEYQDKFLPFGYGLMMGWRMKLI